MVDYLDRYFPNSIFTLSLFEPSEESFDICPPMFSLRSDWEEGGDWICYSRFDYLRTPANKALYSDLKAKLSALYREHMVDLPELNVAYSANYRYDALGRILHQQQLVGNSLGSFESERHDYRYDAAGRLKAADSWEFEYDANGNRVKSTQDGFLETLATYDTEDRLLSFGNRTYTYDANGARQTQTENGTETRYRYDNLGALKSVTKSGQTIDYITDATGRRVGRKVNGSVESYFTYQDSLRPIAQYNADGSIRWTIVYAERMNVPSLLISSNGTRYRVVSDHLGSVRLIINILNGQIVQRMDYDVWGKVTHDSNPNFQPFGFAGGLYDSATELVRFGARDYDPHVGRWLSKDPIGFAGEDTNLYGYTFSDPVNWIDPTGLWAWGDPLPQGLVDFSAGMGDTILFGFGDELRDFFGVDGGVDKCSSAYGAGEWAGIGVSFVGGGAAGWKAAGTKGVKGSGIEFSHWIPKRMGGPRSLWNGNFVTKRTHALSDKFRYNFMPKAWKNIGKNKMYPIQEQQWIRLPNVYKGMGAGGAYGAVGAGILGEDCECK